MNRLRSIIMEALVVSDLSFLISYLCPHSLSLSAAVLWCSQRCYSSDVALWSWTPQNKLPNKHLLFITSLASAILFQQQRVDRNCGLRMGLAPRRRHCLHSDDGQWKERVPKGLPQFQTQPQDSQPPPHVITMSL